MTRDINFGELMKRLDDVGWQDGYDKLKNLHESLENRQAFLWSDPATYKQAEKMAPMLLKQDETLIKIKILADERGIELKV